MFVQSVVRCAHQGESSVILMCELKRKAQSMRKSKDR